nr:MAG TPA: Nuclease [Caudoviricetes sp.]
MTRFLFVTVLKCNTVTWGGNLKSEQEIQNEIRVGLTKAGHMVFRTNVGKVKTMDGRWFDTGLPKGHPDLYGFRSDGQIFYIEVKNEKGRVRPAQEKFIEVVKQRGALAGVARSLEEALEIVDERN